MIPRNNTMRRRAKKSQWRHHLWPPDAKINVLLRSSRVSSSQQSRLRKGFIYEDIISQAPQRYVSNDISLFIMWSSFLTRRQMRGKWHEWPSSGFWSLFFLLRRDEDRIFCVFAGEYSKWDMTWILIRSLLQEVGIWIQTIPPENKLQK